MVDWRTMAMRERSMLFFLAILIAGAGCARTEAWTTVSADKLSGPLISSRTTMVTAWEFPRNPLTDASLGNSKLDDDIRWGFKLFTDTSGEAPNFSPGKVSCNNCHLNGGQRERSLPLVGVATMFPEYNRRSGRLYSLADRIVDCFMRSQNVVARRIFFVPNVAVFGRNLLSAFDRNLSRMVRNTQVSVLMHCPRAFRSHSNKGENQRWKKVSKRHKYPLQEEHRAELAGALESKKDASNVKYRGDKDHVGAFAQVSLP